MTKDFAERDASVAVASPGMKYEAPRLMALGNLRDLVASTSGSACDAVVTSPGNGHEDVCG